MYGARPCCSALREGIGGLGPLMFDSQTGSAPCIVSVSGAPFIMAWRFSRGSYFDLAKSFPARLINRYLRAAGALLLLPPGRASFWWIGARDRPQDALGRAPLCGEGPRRAAEEGGAAANLDLRTLDDR